MSCRKQKNEIFGAQAKSSDDKCKWNVVSFLIMLAEHAVQLNNKATFDVSNFQVIAVFLLLFVQLNK